MTPRGIASEDLFNSLTAADALDTFLSLPEKDRHTFEEWIERAHDDDARWRRIDTLVMAMRVAPRIEGTDPPGRVVDINDA